MRIFILGHKRSPVTLSVPQTDRQREAIALLDAAANEDGYASVTGLGSRFYDPETDSYPHYYIEQEWL